MRLRIIRSFDVMDRALLLLCASFIGASFAQPGSKDLAKGFDQDALPEVNQRIVDYVRGQMGKQVGRGECWDLAAGALNASSATWDDLYGFGKRLDWRSAKVLPGDIVQLENVSVVHRSDSLVSRDTFGKHTAVVLEVKERGVFTLAHQNFNKVRTVSTIGLRMADVKGGKLLFYRPQGAAPRSP